MGTITSVESVLASTGGSNQTLSNTSPAQAINPTPAVVPSVQDLVEISNVPDLSQVTSLQNSNPTQFQAVLSDAERQLRAAAMQSTDPWEAAYLSSLANRFQELQASGTPDLSKPATAAA
jgi:hypothetical protein